MKCLIVDDDELSRALIAEFLRGIASSEMALNGLDAVGKFQAAMRAGFPYDLIILDIVMPEMNGHEAARAIRGIEQERGISPDKGVSIIVLSNLGTPRDVIESYVSVQSAAHLVKPVSQEKLMKTLRTLELVP